MDMKQYDPLVDLADFLNPSRNLGTAELGEGLQDFFGAKYREDQEAKFFKTYFTVDGPLTFLSIHAAGLCGRDDEFGSKLSDFVISSYTPSMAALIERSPTGSPKVSRLLAVAQPNAFGQVGKLPVLRLEKDTATVDWVKAGMLNSDWSALLLAGKEQLTLSSIIKLSLRGNFAFLSACQTATGDKKLQEESVHLAAGMILAGYRGVIATMWTIMNNDALQVAGDVYEHLFKTSPPDSTRAAEALHLAARNLREQSGGKKSFSIGYLSSISGFNTC
ncbi:hypothetical protein B0H19DRAFT_1272661 [Mycena capillaripes]|nr:hypothetical protein B0H19DRAFT_1272661 [Mycena capillaripes]